jgi:hypothetical protein
MRAAATSAAALSSTGPLARVDPCAVMMSDVLVEQSTSSTASCSRGTSGSDALNENTGSLVMSAGESVVYSRVSIGHRPNSASVSRMGFTYWVKRSCASDAGSNVKV